MVQRDPRIIGGIYRIGSVMSTNEMLTIYTASNNSNGEMVGLSVIQIPTTIAVERVQAYLQPLGRRQRIQSPYVIPLDDYGIDGTRIYLVTDAPRGVTLHYVLDTEDIDIPRALELTRQLAQGVKALHEHGVVGLDLRPQLITVHTTDDTDRVQIDDIGLRFLLRNLGYTGSRQMDDLGSFDPRYAPPEYIGGGSIGPWSDVYQLGLLMFELVTGRLPFVGRNPTETGVLQRTSRVPQMKQYKPDVPDSLQSVVEQALAKGLSDRFANVGQFLIALETAQLQPALPVQAPGPTREMAPLPKVEDDATILRARSDSDENRQEIPQEEGVYAYLCIEKDGQEIQRYALTEKLVVVGRADSKQKIFPEVDLTVPDTEMSISRRHARLRLEDALFYIEDLRSHNGTRVGTLQLKPGRSEVLHHGDVVEFGSVRMVFKVPKSMAPNYKLDKTELK
jgi:serine/threonine protein kinase